MEVAISIPQVLQLGSWVELIMMWSGSLIMHAEHTQGCSLEIRRTSRALARETTAAWKQELWSWANFSLRKVSPLPVRLWFLESDVKEELDDDHHY